MKFLALLLFCCSLSAEPVTYTNKIGPLLLERCAPCHRPGEAAPFSLLDGIVATCGFYDYNRNQAILKKVAEEQRKGSRWYREK